MRVLKVLYVCWVVFGGLACIIGGSMAHNGTFVEMMYAFVLVCLFPLLPYFYYLIYEKTKSKNIFVAISCHLLLFAIICCYLLLFVWLKNNNASFYLIGIIIHIVTFAMIYKSKRNSNEANNE